MKTHAITAISLAAVLMVGAVTPAFASNEVKVAPGSEMNQESPKKGWFWYKDPKKAKKPEPETIVVPPAPKQEPQKAPIVIIPKSKKPIKELTEEEREKVCGEQESWEAACGFVDPGDSFEFQAKQRDELLKMMSLTPDNPEAVEAAQRYMKWVVGKASMAANMWYFNMVQNPDLDPRVKNPISEVGIALATRVANASQVEYFRLIQEEGGVLFFITRADCAYCHDQAPYAKRVAKNMGLPLINVPLDGVCLPDFTGDDCAPNIPTEQVAALNVRVVPTMFLYVPSNTWIRLGTGITPDETIMANTVNFFSAYRSAMINGLDNSKGSRPSVTFDPKFNVPASGAVNAEGPGFGNLDKGRMMELLGYDEGSTSK